MSPRRDTGRARLPEAGARVWLEDLPGGPWPALVERVRGGAAALSPPRLAGERVELPLGRTFRMTYSVDGMPFEAPAVLVARPEDDGGSYWVRLAGAPHAVQRRQAVRVPVQLMAAARLADGTDGGEVAVRAIADNLSGGGALLRVAQPLPVGVTMRLDVQCGGEAGTVSVAARVLRCDRAPLGPRPWRIALAFADIPRADQDRIVRFVFERQRASIEEVG